MGFVEVTRTSEVPEGKMLHFEAKGHEIVVVNLQGTFYALNDRCGHMNAYLSMGALKGSNLVCPMHFAEFDVKTGKLLSPPKEFQLPGMDKLPKKFVDYLAEVNRLVAPVKTHDLRTYDVKIIDDIIHVRI